MRYFCVCVALVLSVFVSSAQRPVLGKMSSLVRELAVREHTAQKKAQAKQQHPRSVCAFVRMEGDGKRILEKHGCRMLTQVGDIYIVDIPIHALSALSQHVGVKRIEANRSHSLLMDSTAIHLNTQSVYAGTDLPQAYTGEGVVVGVVDVGFDLTHPNFYDSTTTNYRIKRFWDQLSIDTIGSALFVGADYTTEATIKDYAHSRDGLIQTHGTHTLGIAAGSGYDSPYRGMAYESDICLVSNAVSSDISLIDEADIYKYTYATDALAFKYCFDYAESVGKPCVVSFSEGSPQDFRGDDQLFYEMIENITGPGKIFVAAAGNDGGRKTYFRKMPGTESVGAFFYTEGKRMSFSMKSKSAFSIRTTIYDSPREVLTIETAQVLAAKDSIYVDTLTVGSKNYIFTVTAYPSCYDDSEMVYECYIEGEARLGLEREISVELVGDEADVELFKGAGYISVSGTDASLNAGEMRYSIHSPSSAPAAICVGGTAYRTGIVNYQGTPRTYNMGTGGVRYRHSSVGPTYDERVKPDVMAPGVNVISSYSSYYIEANPTAGDVGWDVAHFGFNGRTYAWNSNSGTSMSTPAVAGAIALWLQAKPTLTREEIMDVFSRTCTHYDASLSYPNNEYGYGQIDVYRGLLDILGVSGIEEVSKSHTAARIGVSPNGMLTIMTAEPVDHPFTVKVYSVSGMLLYTEQMEAGRTTYTLDLSRLPSSAVYAVQINGDKKIAGSTLIRL